MEKDKLLIIEDDEDLRTQMKWGLGQDYEVFLAGDGPSALEVFVKERPPVVALDLGLPPIPGGVKEGFLAMEQILEKDPLTKVIVITGRNEKEHSLKAIVEGAYDFINKPIQLDQLRVILERALYLWKLEREHLKVKEKICEDGFEGMLGSSTKMQEAFSMIRKVATTDAPVLIVGESGTGKELAAQAIHRRSLKKNNAFVAINCGAIPENLLESELFGHEKGSFTGAYIRQIGRIELAKGGTLFLDEIGELSPKLQVKLLRFLQEKRIERIGGREEIIVDARVIAASNTNLTQAMKDGLFREDLYYRLGVVVLALPPIRDRQGDVTLLAKFLLQKYAVEYNKNIMEFDARALQTINRYGWPGNVRELENKIKRAVIMAEGRKVTPSDLELDSPYTRYGGVSLKEARELLEKHLVQRALEKNNGNITHAAAELDVSRPTLYELIEKLNISRNK
jgi:two-component system NtrC family response regulator